MERFAAESYGFEGGVGSGVVFQLAIIFLMVALAAFFLVASSLFSRLSSKKNLDVFSLLGFGCVVLSAVVNALVSYLSYKFSLVAVGFAGLMFVFALWTVVIFSVAFFLYYVVATFKWIALLGRSRA